LIQELLTDADLISPELTFMMEIEEGVVIPLDSVLVGQIVHNLLSNAIKYNQPGGKVEIRLQSVENSVHLEISNTGEPIPEAFEARIFERFFRVDSSHSSNIEGSGLGLSLAYEFTKAHSGNLVLSKNTEERISFLLTLPREPS